MKIKKNAFTIIELLVVLAVIGVFAVLLTLIFQIGLKIEMSKKKFMKLLLLSRKEKLKLQVESME